MAEVVFHCTACGFAHKVDGAALPSTGVKGSCRGCKAVLTVFPGGRVEGPPPLAPPVELPPPPELAPEPVSAMERTVLAGEGFRAGSAQALRPGQVAFRCPYCGAGGERLRADLSPAGTPSFCGTCAQGFLLYPDGHSTGEDGASAVPTLPPPAPPPPGMPPAPASAPAAGARVIVPCPFCGAPNERDADAIPPGGAEEVCPLCAMSYRAYPDGRVEGGPPASPPPAPQPPPPAAAAGVPFRCPYCGAGGERPLADLKPGGVRSVCGTCVQFFVIFPDGRTEEAEEPPAPSPAPSRETGPATPPAPLPPGILLFTCPACGRESRVPQEKIPPKGAKARCKGCENRWLLLPDGRTQPADQPPPTDESTRWEVRMGEDALGPFRLVEMKDLVRSGSLKAETLVRPVGSDWVTASQFPLLAALFAPKAAPAEVPVPHPPGGAPAEEEPFPEGPLGDFDHCYAHPDRIPSRTCTNCNKHLCDACAVPKIMDGHTKPTFLCAACGGPTAPLSKRIRWTPFHRDMGQVLLSPLRGVGLLYLGFLAGLEVVKYLCSFAPLIGFIGTLIVSVFQWTYLLNVIRDVANGSYELPSWPDASNYGDMLFRFLKVVFVTLVALAPVIVAACFFGAAAVTGAALSVASGGQGGAAGGAALLILAFALVAGFFYLCYLPMSVGIVAVFDTVLPALNPVIIFRILFRIGAPWFFAVGIWFSFSVLEVGGALAFQAIPFFGVVLNAALASYVNLVTCYVLGRVLAENEHKIGWA